MAVALLLCAANASADAPITMPVHDVDIVYRVGPPDARDALQERVRWDVARGLQRIDPPTPGLHMLLDYRARRVVSVRDGERLVLVIENAMPPATAGNYVRHGEDSVDGLRCTVWQATAGQESPLLCISADGVTLRLSLGGRVVIEAVSVSYGAADPAAFAVPPDYKWITPAPGTLSREKTQ